MGSKQTKGTVSTWTFSSLLVSRLQYYGFNHMTNCARRVSFLRVPIKILAIPFLLRLLSMEQLSFLEMVTLLTCDQNHIEQLFW